jgi:exopolysaccharide biosynthesis polyprenyl glycosylphosphotransferase
LIKIRKPHTFIFIALDYAMAGMAWFVFFAYRKYFIETDKFGYKIPFEPDTNLLLGLLYVPVYWIVIYYITGSYTDVWRKSRLKELGNTFTIVLMGVVILFFVLLLDDEVSSYKVYYNTFFTLFGLHYGFTILARVLFETYIKGKIIRKQIGFNSIIVGNNKAAYSLFKELSNEDFPSGYIIKGFVCKDGLCGEMGNEIKCLGVYDHLQDVIHTYQIEEVIIAIESSKHQEILQVSNMLDGMGVILKIIPDTYDLISGNVKFENVVGTALIEVKSTLMPTWQWVTKRVIDTVVSAIVLILLLPLFFALSIAVKMSSDGPVFFKQIRIGRFGKPFHIYKFRSMYTNAEDAGPALASKNDKRITPLGKILRKYRLDELPQFYNVLIGDMSLVGPRPERKYYIDQIVQHAPYYKQLLRVRPGITSWGMVKYGYAENVQQMVERLKFDVLYIENMSLLVDFRVMIYTIKTIVQGRGK